MRPPASSKCYAIARIGLAYLNARVNHQNPANTIRYFNPDASADEHIASKPDVNANENTAPHTNTDKDAAPNTNHYFNSNTH